MLGHVSASGSNGHCPKSLRITSLLFQSFIRQLKINHPSAADRQTDLHLPANIPAQPQPVVA